MIWLKGVWLAVVIYTSLPRRKARAKDTQHHKILGSRTKEPPRTRKRKNKKEKENAHPD